MYLLKVRILKSYSGYYEIGHALKPLYNVFQDLFVFSYVLEVELGIYIFNLCQTYLDLKKAYSCYLPILIFLCTNDKNELLAIVIEFITNL